MRSDEVVLSEFELYARSDNGRPRDSMNVRQRQKSRLKNGLFGLGSHDCSYSVRYGGFRRVHAFLQSRQQNMSVSGQTGDCVLLI